MKIVLLNWGENSNRNMYHPIWKSGIQNDILNLIFYVYLRQRRYITSLPLTLLGKRNFFSWRYYISKIDGKSSLYEKISESNFVFPFECSQWAYMEYMHVLCMGAYGIVWNKAVEILSQFFLNEFVSLPIQKRRIIF